MYSLPLQEVGHEGDVVLAVPFSALGQLVHHRCVARSCSQQQQASVVLGVMKALLCQAKLALIDSQFCQLLPLLLRLDRIKNTKKKTPPNITFDNGHKRFFFYMPRSSSEQN